MNEIRVGISGWRYAGWRGSFYPEGLKQDLELQYAAARLNTIEINGSFYSLQTPKSYRDWYASVPEDFLFAVKGPRFITHMKRLKEIEAPLANFFASGVLALREKLGPFLWQFPPNLKYDHERFANFFKKLPRTYSAASKLARGHDKRVAHRTYLPRTASRQRLKHVVEIRHPSFVNGEFLALLREHDIGLVVADTGGRFPELTAVTSSVVYVRLHGGEEIYSSQYSDKALAQWEKRIRKWRRAEKDVFVFFDNDKKVHAPFDAMKLQARLTDSQERRRAG